MIRIVIGIIVLRSIHFIFVSSFSCFCFMNQTSPLVLRYSLGVITLSFLKKIAEVMRILISHVSLQSHWNVWKYSEAAPLPCPCEAKSDTQ